MAVASKPPSVRAAASYAQEPFYCRETVIAREELLGIEETTLDEIRAVDPNFIAESWNISRVLFLDTETTGLSGGAGTVAFEVGLGYMGHQGLVIRQYIMRDYGEEAAMLTEIAELIQRFDTIVSFNGKSFDLPLLESRMVMCRIRLPLTRIPNLDLLHAARRVYKLRLRRCNLSALEEAVLGQHRIDDLPGAQVPQRYFDYIRTRDFTLLEDVLRHNLDDVKSLAILTAHLCKAFRSPQMLEYPEDIFSVGKSLVRGGCIQKARECFRIIGKSTLSAQGHWHLSASYKKERDWEQAIAVWQDMIAAGEGGTMPYIELAKYHEHVSKNIPTALEYARKALQVELNRATLISKDQSLNDPLLRRIARLKRKQSCREGLNIQEDMENEFFRQ